MANTTGNNWAAKYRTSQRTPNPPISAPQPATIGLGGAYAFAGGMTNASTIIQPPKTRKINGKAAKKLTPEKNTARITAPRIITKTLALRGAQGRRFNTDSDSLKLSPVYSIIVLRQTSEDGLMPFKHAFWESPAVRSFEN
jgi:hypothetical protein